MERSTSQDCGVLEQWARDKPDGNGFWGICVAGRGSCGDDAGQICDIGERQACSTATAGYGGTTWRLRPPTCARGPSTTAAPADWTTFLLAASILVQELAPDQLDGGTTRTLRGTIGSRVTSVDAAYLARAAAALVGLAKLYRGGTRTDPAEREEAVRRALRQCTKSKVLDRLSFRGEKHPRLLRPIFLPARPT